MRIHYACREVEGTLEPVLHIPMWPLGQSEYSISISTFQFFNLKCVTDTKVLYTCKKYIHTLWSKLCMGYTNMNTDPDLYYEKSKNRAIRSIVALYSYRCIPSKKNITKS